MTAASRRTVEPLDPDSDKGKQIARDLSEAIADIREAIAARRRQAELARTGT